MAAPHSSFHLALVDLATTICLAAFRCRIWHGLEQRRSSHGRHIRFGCIQNYVRSSSNMLLPRPRTSAKTGDHESHELRARNTAQSTCARFTVPRGMGCRADGLSKWSTCSGLSRDVGRKRAAAVSVPSAHTSALDGTRRVLARHSPAGSPSARTHLPLDQSADRMFPVNPNCVIQIVAIRCPSDERRSRHCYR